MATFLVDDVKRETSPMRERDALEVITERSGMMKPEAWSAPIHTPIGDDGKSNGLLQAVHLAYASHYPLVLTPDAVWMCIAQGFAHHVNQNAEKLRNMFVEHDGKKVLTVRRDDFVKGLAGNPWPEVFDSFSDQILEHVGAETHEVLTPDFSTTTRVDRAAAQVVLMSTFQAYFSYCFHTLCGIPEITLRGTVEDWKKLRDKALKLEQYDFKWWTDELKPILDQFVSAASGNVDRHFWSRIYKQTNASGGPYISGWIVNLFPYLKGYPEGSFCINRQLQMWEKEWENKHGFGILTSDSIPSGVMSTPFKWQYYDNVFDMQFRAGFMVVTQDRSTLEIHPEIGWAVADAAQTPPKPQNQRFM